MPDPVTIYVVRHALAAERGPEYPDDTRRPLTPKGIERFREGVAALAALEVQLEEILTSPYVRARQTADLLAEGFDPAPKITNMHALAEGSATEVVETLARHARRKHLALVGHAPGIGEIAARLIGSRRPLEFKKGAIACVEVEALPLARPGTLRWFLTLRMLQRMAP